MYRYANAGEDLYHKHSFKDQIAEYEIKFTKDQIKECYQNSSCWLFLGEVGDSLEIKLNNHKIANYPNFSDFESHKFYLSNESIKPQNILSIIVRDLNQTRFGLRSKNIGIGTKDEVEWKSQKDWLIRTGAPLLSSFTLFIIFLGLLAVFTIYRNYKLIPLIGLSLVSTIYMLSFSSIPREFIDPIYASGPIHFTARLLVDLFTLLVALTLYKVNQKNKYLKTVPYLYILPIAVMTFGYIANIHAYEFYKITMLIAAPLVTVGSISLFILGLAYFDRNESLISVPIFTGFVLFQIYDLLVFWQILSGAFTVKIYLPFLILTFVWIFIRRRIHEINTIHLDAVIGEQFKKVSHDLLSPIQRIYSLIDISDNQENSLLKKNIDELQLVANSLLGKQESNTENKSIKSLLEDLKEKYESTHSTKIELDLEKMFSWYQIDYSTMLRVFQNLINNSIKANANLITICGYYKDGHANIDFKDNGKGISKSLQPYIFDRGTSSSDSNSGLGLNYAKNALNSFNAEISLRNSNQNGTFFKMRSKIGEIVLIDDNPLVIDTWSTLASRKGLRLQTFTDDTFSQLLTKTTEKIIFIDQNCGKKLGNEIKDILKKTGYKALFIISSANEDFIDINNKAFPI
jgi:signal transduction histidine kinase